MGDAPADRVREIRITNCFHLLAISLMYWDHFITLADEIRFLWKRARSASAYWFFAIRYVGLTGNIPVTLFTFYSMGPQATMCRSNYNSCPQSTCAPLLVVPRLSYWAPGGARGHAAPRLEHVLPSSEIVANIWSLIVVMLLRMYALYGRNMRLLACILGLSTPLLAVIVLQIDLTAAWGTLFMYDSLIFGLTVGKTYATWRRAGSQGHMPIHSLIFRDGALYFAAMALSNLCNIVTFYKTLLQPILAGSLSTFASCVSVTMISRLMLNLHEKAHVNVLTHLNLSFDDAVVLGARRLAEHGQTWATPTGWSSLPPRFEVKTDGHSHRRHSHRCGYFRWPLDEGHIQKVARESEDLGRMGRHITRNCVLITVLTKMATAGSNEGRWNQSLLMITNAEKSWALALAALVNALEAYDFGSSNYAQNGRLPSGAILMPKQYRRTFKPRPSSKSSPRSGRQATMPETRSLIRFRKTRAYAPNNQWIRSSIGASGKISRFFRPETHDGTEIERGGARGLEVGVQELAALKGSPFCGGTQILDGDMR
ncbi:hypothetical protein DFH09DRAFT_1396010 [Mycena vulgaris]|nr:hypothetical protein DFH09DRAFT_1396010 [Mycena vulgaris]